MTRNPLTDPRPGDVTRSADGDVRVVFARSPDAERPGLVQWRRVLADGDVDMASASVETWNLYNADAEVLYAAGAGADPTPLPAPALGMRAWYSYDDAGYDEKPLRCSGSTDISEIGEGDAWDDWVVPDRIDLITDYRTGEVLWRRQ